jgi:hypothetical protein
MNLMMFFPACFPGLASNRGPLRLRQFRLPRHPAALESTQPSKRNGVRVLFLRRFGFWLDWLARRHLDDRSIDVEIAGHT